MSEKKHTSGQWGTWHSDVMKNRSVSGPTAAASMVAIREIDDTDYLMDVRYSEVVSTNEQTVSLCFGETQEEAEANAKLIAAAPYMLRTLEKLLPEMRGLAMVSPLMRAYVDMCDSAICLATGEKS